MMLNWEVVQELGTGTIDFVILGFVKGAEAKYRY
jgi:hypothetical protein